MALKLRRGISANRTNIVPAEGELIYTTDTKVIYVGDGSTPGGNVVTSSGGGGGEITGITDNTTSPVMTLNDTDITLGQDLILGGNIDITNHQIDGDGDINITGDITASGLGTGIITANSFIGNVTGDLTGSVFADDSTLLIDAVAGNIPASVVNGTFTGDVAGNITGIITATSIESDDVVIDVNADFNMRKDSDKSVLTLTYVDSDADLSTSNADRGQIIFQRNDTNGAQSESFIAGGRTSLYAVVDDGTGSFPQANTILLTDGGQFGIGTYTPTAKLDVAGDANVSGTLTADTIVSNASGTPEISSAAGIVITAANDFEVDAANMQIDDTDVKLKLDLQIEGVEMLGRVASNDATAFIPAVVSSPILSSIAGTDTLDGTDRVKEILRYDYDRYTSGGEILIAINDYDTATGADQFLVKKFLFHDSAGDGSAFTVTEIGTSGNAGLFTSLTVASVEDTGNFFLTFTLRSPDAAITGASMLVTGQTTFTSNPLAASVSGY